MSDEVLTKVGRGLMDNTIPKAAKKSKALSEGQLRRAIDKGLVKTVDFNGLKRVPDAEIERVNNLLEAS